MGAPHRHRGNDSDAIIDSERTRMATLFNNGMSYTELSRMPWKTRGGSERKVGYKAIKELILRHRRVRTEEEHTNYMLFGDDNGS